jgi:tetratricopeptide (TPR) repeat protein
MNETFDYIDSYFTGRCTDTERQQFEDRCVDDQAFAEEVAFYIQTRGMLKEELLNTKKTAWAAASKTAAGENSADGKTGKLRLLYLAASAAAAAVAVLAISLYLLTRPSGPAELAATYIHTRYDHLSQTLDGTRDSLAEGITAYNNQKFDKALGFFTALAHHGNTDALLYSGLAYLRLQQYDQALQQFDTLANLTSLYSNPGPFLKAVTLLQRKNPGDRETARGLLQDIVRRQLDGSREAAAWLEKF